MPTRVPPATFDAMLLFRRSVAAGPAREALRIGDRSWSYAELDRLSDAVAAQLQSTAPQARRIPFIADKSLHSYLVILAALKTGKAYVPLAPEGPVARWADMLDAIQATVIMAGPEEQAGAAELAAMRPGLRWIGMEPPPARPFAHAETPEDEAYVLFTSGSTGKPKGVPVLRKNLAAYLGHILTAYAFVPEDRFTHHFALTFDLGVHDLFVCWGAGACLVVPPGEGALRAAAFVREQAITVWFSVPSLALVMHRMRMLKPDAMPTLRLSFFCGEALPWSLARAWQQAAPHSAVIDLYGPTEATIAIMEFRVPRSAEPLPEGTVPLGNVFPGHQARVLREGQLFGHGSGELCLSGPQVTSGYLGVPEAAQRAFAPIPGVPGTWYHTGDRVYLDDSGVAHFLGRVDHQVKVKGHRVEPAEVDAALAQVLGGGTAITIAVEGGGQVRLVTFIDAPANIGHAMEHLRKKLPAYMLPEKILVLPEIPLTAHGKTDRNMLVQLARKDEQR